MPTILQFPKIETWPCNFNDMSLLDILSENECENRIKEALRSHMRSCYMAHRYKYPTEPKELYIVPFSQVRESHKTGLRPVKFAALWLPSLASDIAKLRELVPEELKESPIVAWDNDFSVFKGNLVLHMDPGFGQPLFILTNNQGFDYPDDWQFLAEFPESE